MSQIVVAVTCVGHGISGWLGMTGVASGVASGVAQRRDDFLSPEFRWLVTTLRQTARPLDRRNLAVLVDSFNRMAETAIDVEQVIADAESC